MAETFESADPSWFPRVLKTLARDYPEISDEVWATAIAENAMEQNDKLLRQTNHDYYNHPNAK